MKVLMKEIEVIKDSVELEKKEFVLVLGDVFFGGKMLLGGLFGVNLFLSILNFFSIGLVFVNFFSFLL